MYLTEYIRGCSCKTVIFSLEVFELLNFMTKYTATKFPSSSYSFEKKWRERERERREIASERERERERDSKRITRNQIPATI